jgi:hypothetical protein
LKTNLKPHHMNETLIATLVFISMMMTPIRNLRGQETTTPVKLKIEKQVDSAFHDMIKAAESFDFDKLSKGVDDTYHAGFIVNGGYFVSFDSLLNNLKERAQGARQMIVVQKQKITVLSESIALLTAYGDAQINIDNGNSFTAKFYWSFVYQFTGNKWKVIQSHQSGAR